MRVSQGERFRAVKRLLREAQLHTVCEEASCPNIGECFGNGTATFMVLGDLCTRRCPFCDVAHGRPLAARPRGAAHLADTVARLGLNYVVITSVDRDDLRDGGAAHFAACIRAVRERSPAHPHRGADARLPRARGNRARDPLRRCPRRHEPQSRDGAAPLSAGAAGRRLRAFAPAAAVVPAAPTGRADQVRPDAGARRDRRRSSRGDARPAPARRRDAHRRPVPAAPARQPSGETVRAAATSSRRSRRRHGRWALPMPPAVRSCARATTPIGKPSRPASEPGQRISRRHHGQGSDPAAALQVALRAGHHGDHHRRASSATSGRRSAKR